MRWQLLLVCLASGGVLVSGCAPNKSLLKMDPDVIASIYAMDDASTQVRAQAPEDKPNNSGKNLLDVPPSRATGLDKLPAGGRICATVNGQAILEEEVRASAYRPLMMAQRYPEPDRTKKINEIWKAALDSLIEREVVLQDAYLRINTRGAVYLERIKKAAAAEFEETIIKSVKQSAKVKTEEELEAVLKQQGASKKMMQSQFEKQYIAREYLRSRVFPTVERVGHRQVRQYYDDHPEKFKVDDSVVWQDIFISMSKHPNPATAKQYAEILAQRIRKGEDFVKIAKEYDDGVASLREKSLGVGKKRGEINPPEAEAILFQLQPGEVGPIIELPTGFHIVRVLEKTKAGKRPFDAKLQKQIRNQLRNQIADREMKRIVERLKREAIVEYSSYRP